jgi:hypothetical protein
MRSRWGGAAACESAQAGVAAFVGEELRQQAVGDAVVVNFVRGDLLRA